MATTDFDTVQAMFGALSESQQKTLVRAAKRDNESKVAAVLEAKLLEQPASPRCQSAAVVKFGRANGLQRFRCEACHRPSTA